MDVDGTRLVAERTRLAAIHRIIDAFAASAERLGVAVPPAALERWGVLVHQAMAGRARSFHGHDHVLDLARAEDPIATIAGLFHDVVYVQVDQAIAPALEPLLAASLGPDQTLLPLAAGDREGRLVYLLFGVEAGGRPSPYGGLNELASALVAARALGPHLPPEVIAEVVACIEATIPFRPAAVLDALADRLRRARAELGLALDDARVAAAVRRAVRVANHDVANFAEPDPDRFLDNTWKLLPETNPALRSPTGYGVREYRTALDRMEGFLATLGADRVFHRWGGEPEEHVHAALVDAAARNLALAVRYLRCKLLAIAVLEALAEETGGDAPLELFTGGLPRPYGPARERIESHLPPPETVAVAASPDAEELRALLASGRAGEAGFDLRASPLSTFLLDALGEAAVARACGEARRMFRRELGGAAFLALLPGRVVAAVAGAAARVAFTRRDGLRALAAAAEAR